MIRDLYFAIQPDPYLGISGDYQVYVKPQADVKDYSSATDNQVAASLLNKLHTEIYEADEIMVEILVHVLSGMTEVWLQICETVVHLYLTFSSSLTPPPPPPLPNSRRFKCLIITYVWYCMSLCICFHLYHDSM